MYKALFASLLFGMAYAGECFAGLILVNGVLVDVPTELEILMNKPPTVVPPGSFAPPSIGPGFTTLGPKGTAPVIDVFRDLPKPGPSAPTGGLAPKPAPRPVVSGAAPPAAASFSASRCLGAVSFAASVLTLGSNVAQIKFQYDRKSADRLGNALNASMCQTIQDGVRISVEDSCNRVEDAEQVLKNPDATTAETQAAHEEIADAALVYRAAMKLWADAGRLGGVCSCAP